MGVQLYPPDNPLEWDNTIKMIDMGGLLIADRGDNRWVSRLGPNGNCATPTC